MQKCALGGWAAVAHCSPGDAERLQALRLRVEQRVAESKARQALWALQEHVQRCAEQRARQQAASRKLQV